MASSDRESDDTDTLLNSDPMGGLFLNLSLKQLADKHKTLSTTTPPPSTELPPPPPSTSDLSDYFNSDGVLSGLAEWTDSELEKDIASELHEDDEGHSSDSSFTYKDNSLSADKDEEQEPHPHLPEDEEHVDVELDVRKEPCAHHHPPGFSHLVNRGRVIDVNLQDPRSGWNLPHLLPEGQGVQGEGQDQEMTLVQGAGVLGSYLDGTGQQIFTRAPNFRSNSNSDRSRALEDVSLPERHLTPQQIEEEVKKMYAEQEEGVGVVTAPKKVLRFAPELEQVPLAKQAVPEFNFLHVQGSSSSPALITFDSSPKPKTPFTLSEKRESGESSQHPGRKKHVASKGKRKSQNSNPSKFQGAGDCEVTTPTTASSSLSLSSNSTVEEQRSVLQAEGPPPLALPSSSVPYSTKVVRGQKRSKPKGPSSKGFSFGYGQRESELSPIVMEEKAAAIAAASPSTPGDQFTEGMDPVKGPGAALEELKTIWRQIQSHRDVLHLGKDKEDPSTSSCDSDTPTEGASSSGRSFIQDLGKGDQHQPSSNSKHEIEPQTSSPSRLRDNVPPHPSVHLSTDLDSELNALLAEADIHPSDFEDIVSNLDMDECDVGGGIDDLLSQIMDPSTSEEARETATLSHWAASGAVAYVEKYYEEKFRRQECEEEIERLQKEILLLRQKTAVLEGNAKRKDATILKISKAWKEVSSEWKSFEGTTRSEFETLKKEHASLAKVAEEGTEKLAGLQRDMEAAVQIGEDFKAKLLTLEAAKETQVTQLEQELNCLHAEMGQMSGNCDKIREEKEAALESLKESQLQLKTLSHTHKTLEEEFLAFKSAQRSTSSKLEQVLNQNSQLEFLLQENQLENEKVRTKFQQELEQILSSSAAEKASLQLQYESQTGQLLKEEGERLHLYYNTKLQDCLTAAGEKASKAQATLVESMKKAGAESERKLAECKIRYHSDLTRIKTIYEVEMQELKKDNLQKQLLISTTAQQLTSGGIVRTETIDRLQNIVSNFPIPNIHRELSAASESILGGGQGDRPLTADNYRLSSAQQDQQLSNIRDKLLNFSSNPTSPRTPQSKMYAKFVQNLETKSSSSSANRGVDNLNLILNANTSGPGSAGELNKLSENCSPTRHNVKPMKCKPSS